jgi:hypothetical protein
MEWQAYHAWQWYSAVRSRDNENAGNELICQPVLHTRAPNQAEADCEGDFMRAKSLHAQAIERYLELLKLEPPGTPRYESLRREAEGCFARAEKVRARTALLLCNSVGYLLG